jgi:hypothetical protein
MATGVSRLLTIHDSCQPSPDLSSAYSVGTSIPNTWTDYYYREPALLAVYQELRNASRAGTKMFLGTHQNNSNQIQTVYFYPTEEL